MSKQNVRKPLSIALGAAVVSTLGVAGVASASDTEADLFAMEELTSGYMTAGLGASKGEGEGSCGEGKCGEDKDGGEGSCGEDKDEGEGSCGGSAI